jgi:uncharacterized protein YuzE
MKLGLVLAGGLTLLAAACSQPATEASRSETVSSVGVVREIEPDTRRFTVRADGQILTLRATDQVKNFDQLAVGDKIRVEYQESVAVGMALPEDDGAPVGASFVATAEEGDKPGVAAIEILSGVVEFVSYDPKTKIATLKLQDGTVAVVEVAREMRGFAKSRQPGDLIEITFQRATAITVEPAS